jgi:hypothetical protein
MRLQFQLLFFKTIKKSLIFTAIFIFSLCSSAHAVLINFDDLDQGSYKIEEGLRPLSNEYQTQGVIFSSSAYLVTWQSYDIPLSQPNYVSGPGFSFDFVGDLPTQVSMYISNSIGYAVNVNAFGPNNFHKSITTAGAVTGMTDNEGTPYIPNQFISFASLSGISSISLDGQAGASMDNLMFTSDVPEPSTLALFGVGMMGLILRRRKIK